MPKIVLIDADGVAIKRTAEYFSQRLSREHGAPIEDVTNFFKTNYRASQRGESDLKELLAPKLKEWGWQGCMEEFLEYWFKDDIPDDEVVAAVQALRARGVEAYLATDQEKYRAHNMVKLLEGKFDGFWFSYDLKVSKAKPEFFQEILRRWDMRHQPHEVAFWDDDMENVETARQAGIDAHFYTSLDEFKKTYNL